MTSILSRVELPLAQCPAVSLDDKQLMKFSRENRLAVLKATAPAANFQLQIGHLWQTS